RRPILPVAPVTITRITVPYLLSVPAPSTALPASTGRSLGACGRNGLGGPFRPQPLTLLCSRSPSITIPHTPTLPQRWCVWLACVCRGRTSHIVKGIPYKHFSWLNAVRWSDNAIFLHHFNHTCRPIIAYSQAALQHGN